MKKHHEKTYVMTTHGGSKISETLRAVNVHKYYGHIPALRGVHLSLRTGEWLGLLGPNGAGKTTLMNALAGLLPVDQGRFYLLGEDFDPVHSPYVAESMGLVPQEIALYDSLTAEENLQVFARFHGVTRQAVNKRVVWALEWTGLTGRARQRISTFSGGMKRRLNIACAVLHAPKVLLLDEPTVGVDPQARQRIWGMLRDFRKSGASLIHSSHQLDEVESTCDRVLILDHGEIKGEGTINDLMKNVKNRPHWLTMRFDAPPAPDAFGRNFRVHGNRLFGPLVNPARDLQDILNIVNTLELEVLELKVEAPRLEALFAEITGKELRE